jgi:hypothetical protein
MDEAPGNMLAPDEKRPSRTRGIDDDHIPVIDDRLDSDDAGRGGPRELSDELIDELLAGARTPAEITGEGGLLAELTRRLIERAMDAELTDHLGYERGHAPPGGAGNSRNGSTPQDVAYRARVAGDPHAARPGRLVLSRRSCASTSAASTALTALTTRSSRSTRAA